MFEIYKLKHPITNIIEVYNFTEDVPQGLVLETRCGILWASHKIKTLLVTRRKSRETVTNKIRERVIVT